MLELIQRFGVLTEEQCSFLIDRYKKELRPSSVAGYAGRVQSPARESESYKIPKQTLRTDIEVSLFRAVNEITDAPLDRIESWEMIHYASGGFFREHYDFLDPKKYKIEYDKGGQRTHSILVYLSDVKRGGDTFFPKLNVSVEPQPGKLVAWNNTYLGQMEPGSMHVARKVEFGHKWVLATWVRERTIPDAAT